MLRIWSVSRGKERSSIGYIDWFSISFVTGSRVRLRIRGLPVRLFLDVPYTSLSLLHDDDLAPFLAMLKYLYVLDLAEPTKA